MCDSVEVRGHCDLFYISNSMQNKAVNDRMDRAHQDFHSVVCAQGSESVVSEIHVLSMDLYFVAYTPIPDGPL